MKRASLLDVNPALKYPAKLEEFLIRHVATSTAIETGENVETIARDLRQFLDDGMPPSAPKNRARVGNTRAMRVNEKSVLVLFQTRSEPFPSPF